MKIVHVGCGNIIIPKAVNIDYIRAYRYINYPKVAAILYHMRLLGEGSYRMIKDLQPVRSYIKYGKATNLPVEDDYADVVYSCHMMEHLTHTDAEKFLLEVNRILKRNGVFRLVLPDLAFYIRKYLENQDADEFMEDILLTYDMAKHSKRERIKYFVYGKGVGGHEYMYDAISAKRLLEKAGFKDIRVLNPGESCLQPIEGIDFSARPRDSFYIECKK